MRSSPAWRLYLRTVARLALLVHGDADSTVPVADSSDLSKATGIALETISGGSHGLSSIVRDGRLVQLVQQVAAAAAPTCRI